MNIATVQPAACTKVSTSTLKLQNSSDSTVLHCCAIILYQIQVAQAMTTSLTIFDPWVGEQHATQHEASYAAHSQ